MPISAHRKDSSDLDYLLSPNGSELLGIVWLDIPLGYGKGRYNFIAWTLAIVCSRIRTAMAA
jgi:hypothetical protein